MKKHELSSSCSQLLFVHQSKNRYWLHSALKDTTLVCIDRNFRTLISRRPSKVLEIKRTCATDMRRITSRTSHVLAALKITRPGCNCFKCSCSTWHRSETIYDTSKLSQLYVKSSLYVQLLFSTVIALEHHILSQNIAIHSRREDLKAKAPLVKVLDRAIGLTLKIDGEGSFIFELPSHVSSIKRNLSQPVLYVTGKIILQSLQTIQTWKLRP